MRLYDSLIFIGHHYSQWRYGYEIPRLKPVDPTIVTDANASSQDVGKEGSRFLILRNTFATQNFYYTFPFFSLCLKEFLFFYVFHMTNDFFFAIVYHLHHFF